MVLFWRLDSFSFLELRISKCIMFLGLKILSMGMTSQDQNNGDSYYLLNTWYTSRTIPRILYEFFHLILTPILDTCCLELAVFLR